VKPDGKNEAKQSNIEHSIMHTPTPKGIPIQDKKHQRKTMAMPKVVDKRLSYLQNDFSKTAKFNNN